jgi:hypothetical protein
METFALLTISIRLHAQMICFITVFISTLDFTRDNAYKNGFLPRFYTLISHTIFKAKFWLVSALEKLDFKPFFQVILACEISGKLVLVFPLRKLLICAFQQWKIFRHSDSFISAFISTKSRFFGGFVSNYFYSHCHIKLRMSVRSMRTIIAMSSRRKESSDGFWFPLQAVLPKTASLGQQKWRPTVVLYRAIKVIVHYVEVRQIVLLSHQLRWSKHFT